MGYQELAKQANEKINIQLTEGDAALVLMALDYVMRNGKTKAVRERAHRITRRVRIQP